MLKEDHKKPPEHAQVDEIDFEGFDHLELFVGNALHASYYYHRGFGFDIVAYRGLHTGRRDHVSYVLKQGSVFLVLTGSLTGSDDVAKHILKHGDGVKTIALRTKDARRAYDTAIARGAKQVGDFQCYEGEEGAFYCGSVQTYGDTIHTFVQRQDYKGTFAPGFKATVPRSTAHVLTHIDHVVGNVEAGQLDNWEHFYEKIFGFNVYQEFDAKDISTKYSALASKVMMNHSGNVKLPMNEPAAGLRKSQIQEYLDYHFSAGVQHIALATNDIVSAVDRLRKSGIQFLTVPKTYYDALQQRVGKIDENKDELARLGILVDRESDGYLLQIFTKPVQDRPTLFFEVIQRKGAKGFGKGNFKALFEAFERDQAARGNL